MPWGDADIPVCRGGGVWCGYRKLPQRAYVYVAVVSFYEKLRLHSFWGRLASLEIEGDDDHLGASLVDRLGEDEFCFVGKVAAVLVDDVK